jgi:transposase
MVVEGLGNDGSATVLHELKRLQLGDRLAQRTAAGCIRQLPREIEALNQRIADLEAQIAALLEEHGNPIAELTGAGTEIAATRIAYAGDVRRFKRA